MEITKNVLENSLNFGGNLGKSNFCRFLQQDFGIPLAGTFSDILAGLPSEQLFFQPIALEIFSRKKSHRHKFTHFLAVPV